VCASDPNYGLSRDQDDVAEGHASCAAVCGQVGEPQYTAAFGALDMRDAVTTIEKISLEQ